MRDSDQICGCCKWHKRTESGYWVCVNNESEYCSDWTGYDDSCIDWEAEEESINTRTCKGNL